MTRQSVNRKASLTLIVLILAFVSCKKDRELSFCEGITPEGKGVNCGTVFSTGDLTAVIKTRQPFSSKTLELKVFGQKDGLKKNIETSTLPVNEGDNFTVTDLSFYNPGKYTVQISDQEKIITSSDIIISDDN